MRKLPEVVILVRVLFGINSMENEIKKEDIRKMYDDQLEGVRLSILASKMHVICLMVQTVLILLIAIKILN